MSHHEIASGQKTPSDLIASRRLRLPVKLDSSAPPHRASTPGYTPQHPLPTRRAGVAYLISALVPDALIGSETARAKMEGVIAGLPWLGMLAVAAAALDFILYAAIVGDVL